MGRMKDVIFQVEELADMGLSLDEIAKRLGIDVPVVQSIFRWVGMQENQLEEDTDIVHRIIPGGDVG